MYFDMYLSLGSNIEPREEYLKLAINFLKKKFIIKKISPIYETLPLEDLDQDYFLNLAIYCLTKFKEPIKNLKIIKMIEDKIGRKRDEKRPKGPRIIDIDIIFISDIIYQSKELNIPHKSFLKRNFVLIPICDILDNNYLKEKYNLIYHISENKNQNVRKFGEINFEF